MRARAISYTLKFILCATVTIGAMLLLGAILTKFIDRRDSSSTASSNGSIKSTLIIDAGHGGEDAGAVADDGTVEKDLNLEIATLIKAFCDLNGTQAVMTRTDDRLLYDHYKELDDYTGHKKLYDLKNRVRIAQEYENAIFVSIHMNKFPQKKYSGAQVYFSKNNRKSEMLARGIQGSARMYLNPSSNRQVKMADSAIYVLNALDCPAVLVECGFLSNDAELGLLKSDEYQARLALVIFSSVLSQLE